MDAMEERQRIKLPAKAASTVTQESEYASPRDSQQSTESVETSELAAGRKQHEKSDEGDDLDDISLDRSVPLVTKSAFKEKKGFLNRLKAASVARKYAPEANSQAVVPAVNLEVLSSHASTRDTQSESEQSQLQEEERPNVEIVLEEEEPIDVAIDQSAQVPVVEALLEENTSPIDFDEDGIAPQVVIHSAESDSDSTGYATLNPIINRPSRREKRGGSFSVMTSATAIGPVLSELPTVDESQERNDRQTLVINALGATGLTKAEKFGTQSTLLEMRVCQSTEDSPGNALASAFMRTALHKKGGSEAQWNQQFSTSLQSKIHQVLFVAVRTNTKLLIGEAMIPLNDVEDVFYDQHYTIYRLSGDNVREPAGQIHLHLKIMDTLPTTGVIPFLALPRPHQPDRQRSIPSALANGALMLKVPYHNHTLVGPVSAHRQWVVVTADEGDTSTLQIMWCDPIDTTDRNRCLDLTQVTEIREGHGTKAFKRLLQSESDSTARESERCFSLITKNRTLDLVASSKEEAQVWVRCLRQLLSHACDEALDASARTIEDFKHSALSSRDLVKDIPSSSPPKKRQLTLWRATLFEYARRNQLREISDILHAGCPIDILESGSGDTLLLLACRGGNVKLVELCLLWRAKNDPHPEFGDTALQIAVKAGHSQCLALILSTAAKSDMDSEIVNHIDSNNDAPLHVAARQGDLASLQLLLHHGADICVVEEFGRTSLHCAILSGSLDCVAYLLDVGGDSVLNAGDNDGDTALHYAAMSGSEKIVKLLLESAADVYSVNVHGETPYDLALREKHKHCAELISKYHQSNDSDPIPAIRNESASLLLLQQKKQLAFDEATSLGDDEDEDEEIVDEENECSTYIEPSSPVRRGPIPVYETYPNDHEYENYPGNYRPSSGSLSSRLPVSPSARVREVLAQQRHHFPSNPPPIRDSHLYYYSAREDIRSAYPAYQVPPRHAMTERIDRDIYPRYSQGFSVTSNRYPPEHYLQSRNESVHSYQFTPAYVTNTPEYYQGRTRSAMQYDNRYNRAAESYQDSVSGWPAVREKWSTQYDRGYHADPESSYSTPALNGGWVAQEAPQQVSLPSVSTSEWETYYTQDGYPYYVNRTTGVSQWENPMSNESTATATEAVPVAPQPTTQVAGTLSADAKIRMRLAEVRREKVSASTRSMQDLGGDETENHPPKLDSKSETEEVREPCRPEENDGGSNCVSSPSRPSETNHLNRAGFNLTVDISSPPRQDESRPVFVPSPKSGSPEKEKGRSTQFQSDPTFEKSTRPSSPRGKSKNVQLLDSKRANNLALALSSFKINDRYEQIVRGIAALDDKVVNAELLICLQRFFPNDDEASLLREYDGPIISLGKAERFLAQLLRIPDVLSRIDFFLYKLQFTRHHRSVHITIQAVKRACRDIVENFSFLEALEKFFADQKAKSLNVFANGIRQFKTEYLTRHSDERFRAFRDDLQKAVDVELLDLQMQFNRLVTGMRSIQAFIDKSGGSDDEVAVVHDVLQRFVAETRTPLIELESEYESMGQWETKLMGVFGESKATCQLSAILSSLCDALEI